MAGAQTDDCLRDSDKTPVDGGFENESSVIRASKHDIPSYSLGLTQEFGDIEIGHTSGDGCVKIEMAGGQKDDCLRHSDKTPAKDCLPKWDKTPGNCEQSLPDWDKTPGTTVNTLGKLKLEVLQYGNEELSKKETSQGTRSCTRNNAFISCTYTKEEEAIWGYLFTEIKEIFETDAGLLMELRRIRSLKPGSEISIDVIECWAAVLNEEEHEGMHHSPRRLFCGPYVFREWMFLQKPLYDTVRLVAFSKAMFAVVGRREELTDLHSYELVMFPILDNGHFYVIAVDLKEPNMFLIDNMEATETVVDMKDNEEYKFKDKPYKVKHVFVEYLHNWKHPKAQQLEDMEIKRLQLKWATRGNIKDCGVFVMRHMECFMGGLESEFDCGFAETDGEILNQIGAPRKKYAARILLSNINKMKNEVLKAANLLSES
ncbi:hypothetical protein E3N88_25666 [Mikania micrantha]|uniref:Ubiquitin-like protease family profile domain-containing protein n=1 Tax=Mikania micrantha TaxID=192012 RepID=A0A5N6N867_9ASTR|nr:hypothetical protein E3N88_25666 [Mikania micrantha]